MKWVDTIEIRALDMEAAWERYPQDDIRDLMRAIRLMEQCLDVVATQSFCNGTQHKITSDLAALTLQVVRGIRNE